MTQNPTKTERTIDLFYPADRQQWRAWLLANHAKQQAIWLVYYKQKSGVPRLSYSDAVDEALCFGWIDSTTKPIDANTYRQFFCRRKPTGTWSKVNKDKVRRLIDAGLMTEAGFAAIETAKQTGSWTILDEVEELLVPIDLAEAFQNKPNARVYFDSLNRTDKRNILQWLVLAKRPDTRLNRITAIVEAADQRQKPSVLQWVKKGISGKTDP